MEINKALMIIAIAGLIGSGKDEVAGYISRKHGYYVIDYADILRGICRDEGLEVTRDNLQNLRVKYGNTFLAEAAVKKAKESGKKNIILTPIRRSEDFTIPEKEFPGIMMILVEAPERVRFERLKLRKRENYPKDFAEFQRQESREFSIYDFDKTFSYAKYKIANNGSVEELHSSIDRIMEEMR